MRCLYALQVTIATAVLLGVGHTVAQLTIRPTDRLHALLYERGPVQYFILAVAALSLVLLYWHTRQYAQKVATFRDIRRHPSERPGVLFEAARKVGQFLAKYGPAAARSEVERFDKEQSRAVERQYETIQVLVLSLPVLGLVGTILGVSDALYGAFSKDFDPKSMSESMERFVAGLSTALDTTMLGMICMAPLLAWTSLQRRAETHLVEQYVAWLRERFGLADVPEGGDQNAYVLHAQLQRLTQQIGHEAKRAFAKIVKGSANVLRRTLAEVAEQQAEECRNARQEAAESTERVIVEQIQQTLGSLGQVLTDQNRQLGERVAEALADRGRSVESAVERIGGDLQRFTEGLPELLSRTMAESLAQIGQSFDRRHALLVEGMTTHMGRLEAALRNRTPEEVVIRYRDNGCAH